MSNLLNSGGSEGEHARATFPAECLGEKCPNFNGTACTNSEWLWIRAKATVEEGIDKSQPPTVDKAIFVTYGQVCLTGIGTKGVRYRVDDYGNGPYFQEETGLLMHGDAAFSEGTDVDLYKVTVAADGAVIDELQRTFEGWD